MAFRLGRGIISATIVPNDVQGSLGCVRCTPIGGWFQPDAEVTRKVRNLVETLVMVSLAGSETQAEWLWAVPDAPADWREQLVVGAAHDMRNVLDLALYVTGSDEEASAYIEWLRLRCQNQMLSTFWPMVGALADALHDRRTMSGAATRTIMKAAGRDWLIRGRRGRPGVSMS